MDWRWCEAAAPSVCLLRSLGEGGGEASFGRRLSAPYILSDSLGHLQLIPKEDSSGIGGPGNIWAKEGAKGSGGVS